MKKNKIIKSSKVLITIISLVSFYSNNAEALNMENQENKTKIIISEKDKIPNLNLLKTSEGKDFDLNKAIKEKPTILIFYRGGWCPFCNAHFSKLQSIESKLLDIGFQIIAISPDKIEKMKESIQKHQMSYLLLSDSKMEVSKAFGLDFKVDDNTLGIYKTFGIDLNNSSGESHNLLPVPSVFIIDTKGIIKFKYSNPDYKTRLEPEIILKEAKLLLSESY
ncbi:MAG: peroxiredoxin-like family protein [Cyanobacteriota bacterium]